MFFKKEYQNLTSYEKEVINYLNSNPSEFVFSSIHNIALKSNVSIGVISRLYKKLGFNSLRELQFFVHHKIIIMNHLDEDPEEKSFKNFAKILSKSLTYSIYKIIENIDNSNCEEIIQKIVNSKAVRIYGDSDSHLACNNLSIGLKKLEYILILKKISLLC